MELIANYMDYSSANSLAAVLRWCDTAGLCILKELSDPTLRQKLEAMWMQSAVMRVVRARMYVRGMAWESTFTSGAAAGTSVLVSPTLVRLGNTSYTLQNQVTLASGTALASVETVMVQLDANLQKAIPIPGDQLRSMLRPSPELIVPLAGEQPASCFTWKVEVRPSDCDLLGHMNNASYAVLFEDARRAASRVLGALDADSDISMASIEYVSQARAFEILKIAVWWNAERRVYGLCMCNDLKTVVARASLVPFQTCRL